MKVKVAIGSTIKSRDGETLGTSGEVIEVDDKVGRTLLAGGSAELVENDKPRRK